MFANFVTAIHRVLCVSEHAPNDIGVCETLARRLSRSLNTEQLAIVDLPQLAEAHRQMFDDGYPEWIEMTEAMMPA